MFVRSFYFFFTFFVCVRVIEILIKKKMAKYPLNYSKISLKLRLAAVQFLFSKSKNFFFKFPNKFSKCDRNYTALSLEENF